MVQGKPRLLKPLSRIQGYGLAVLSVTLALGGAHLLQRFHSHLAECPFSFLFAVGVTAWYGGPGAGALAFLLSSISFDYFFVKASILVRHLR